MLKGSRNGPIADTARRDTLRVASDLIQILSLQWSLWLRPTQFVPLVVAKLLRTVCRADRVLYRV